MPKMPPKMSTPMPSTPMPVKRAAPMAKKAARPVTPRMPMKGPPMMAEGGAAKKKPMKK